MDPTKPFTLLWQTIVLPMDAGTAAVAQALSGYVDGRFQVCVVAYFIVMLLIASWSADEDAMLRFFRQIFLASVIFTIATNAGTYNYYVTGITHGAVSGIGKAIGSFLQNTQPVNANGFDILASQTFAAGLVVYKQLPQYSLSSIALAGLIALYWLFAILALVLMFIVYMSAYVVTDILLATGPLFVALYFFPFTRQWFHGWLRNLMTGILAQVFTIIVAAFFIAVLTAMLTSAGRSSAAAGSVTNEVAIGSILTLVFIAGIAFLFNFIALYTVYMAASIAGGLAPPQPRLTRIPRSSDKGDGGGNHAGGQLQTSGSQPALGGPGDAHAAPPRDYSFNRTVGPAP